MSARLRKLAVRVLMQALLDGARGRRVDVTSLEPWAALCGVPYDELHDAFRRIDAGDRATLLLIGQLRTPGRLQRLTGTAAMEIEAARPGA